MGDVGPRHGVPEALDALVQAWFLERPLTTTVESLSEPGPIPEALAATLTRRDPCRAQLEADARLWLALPQPLALGVRVEVVSPFAARPFEGWEQSVAGLEIRTYGQDRMSPHDALPVETRQVWQRVALEEGEWRLVDLWDEAARAEAASFRDWLLWYHGGRQGPQPPLFERRPRSLVARLRGWLRRR